MYESFKSISRNFYVFQEYVMCSSVNFPHAFHSDLRIMGDLLLSLDLSRCLDIHVGRFSQMDCWVGSFVDVLGLLAEIAIVDHDDVTILSAKCGD